MRADVESAAREMTELVSMVLDSFEPITKVRFSAVRKSDRSPRSQHYEVDLDVMAGYAELFRTQPLRSPCHASTTMGRFSRTARTASASPST